MRKRMKKTIKTNIEKHDDWFIFTRTYIGEMGQFIKNNRYFLTPEQQVFFIDSIKQEKK